MLKEIQVLSILQKTSALQSGHFLLSSGYHSDKYVQCARVLQYPKYSKILSKEIALKFKDKKVEVVIGPALGGITFAYEIARQLKVRGIFAERENGIMQLRRGFEIKKGEKVLIVEDVITTGKSIKEVVDLVESVGGEIVGLGCIVLRDKNLKLGKKISSLLRVDFKKYSKDDCPLCKLNIPMIYPGSRKHSE